jgi:hypothetical protein
MGSKLGNTTVFVRIAVIAARTAIVTPSVRDESLWDGRSIAAARNPAVCATERLVTSTFDMVRVLQGTASIVVVG